MGNDNEGLLKQLLDITEALTQEVKALRTEIEDIKSNQDRKVEWEDVLASPTVENYNVYLKQHSGR